MLQSQKTPSIYTKERSQTSSCGMARSQPWGVGGEQAWARSQEALLEEEPELWLWRWVVLVRGCEVQWPRTELGQAQSSGCGLLPHPVLKSPQHRPCTVGLAAPRETW